MFVKKLLKLNLLVSTCSLGIGKWLDQSIKNYCTETIFSTVAHYAQEIFKSIPNPWTVEVSKHRRK